MLAIIIGIRYILCVAIEVKFNACTYKIMIQKFTYFLNCSTR